MNKKILAFVLVWSLILFVGCTGSGGKENLETVINDAFKARAEAVFKYKAKASLKNHFSQQALDQSKAFLDWSPNGQWNNVKDLKYSYSVRIQNLKINGKQASATVYETAMVSWEYIDPAKVVGTEFRKEDAWANRRHDVLLVQNAEGNWIITQDEIN